jgi:2-dehydro-3-deoxyphosphogluconate aldolase/(4S)-4-hydroxy-2-oxoglutarate aldolase
MVDPGIIAIIRAQERQQVMPAAQALLAGGINAIEITLTTPDAFAAIREASRELGEQALVGVGTVLKPYDCQTALDVGAQFVVTPICRTELVALSHAAEKPVMLGAFTPTEVQAAHEAGADFIKLFPAEVVGPAYVKALRAPLPHLRIIPTGGVTLENLGQWLEAGCPAVGVGGSLVSKTILAKSDWPALTRLAKKFATAAKAAKQTIKSSS